MKNVTFDYYYKDYNVTSLNVIKPYLVNGK